MPNHKIVVNLRCYDYQWTKDENVLNVADVCDYTPQNQTSVNCEIEFSVRCIVTASIQNL